jgi:uncharacterized protein (DUF934 family)
MPTLIDRLGRRHDPWVRDGVPGDGGLPGSTGRPEADDRSEGNGRREADVRPGGDSRHRLIAAGDWLARRDDWLALLARESATGAGTSTPGMRLGTPGMRLGIELGPADEPARVSSDLPRLALVAIRFPVFTDGRGYSLARELRERYGWRGELRATGDVLRDQLFYLARCGFDTFDLRDDQDADAALAAFGDFSEAYQAAFDRGPLFDRRRALVRREQAHT